MGVGLGLAYKLYQNTAKSIHYLQKRSIFDKVLLSDGLCPFFW